MRMRNLLVGVCFLVQMVLVSGVFGESSWQLRSPSGEVSIKVELSGDGGELSYSVRLRQDGVESVMVEKSPLGIVRSDQAFVEGLKFLGIKSAAVIDESYELPHGKFSRYRNHCHEQVLAFVNSAGARLQLVLRAYDDGVAFRYRFPESDAETRKVVKELTGFKVPGEAEAWMQPYDDPKKYTPAYELLYEKVAVGTTSPKESGWAFPVLYRSEGNWAFIAESGVDRSYCGGHLAKEAPGGLYRLAFPTATEANGQGESEPEWSLPWATPWRVVIAGDELADVYESTLILNLSEPTELTDVSWVKPGRVSWSWWSDHASPVDYNKVRKYVDLAAEMGWEYSLVDANWTLMKNGNVHELIEYAKSKGVGLLLWYNSGGDHNSVSERPRGMMKDKMIRREEFKHLRDMGIKGVKVDFIQSDKQQFMQLYLDTLADAAEFEIMVNFHGCTIPRGWERRFPHLMTMEAVSGAEQYWFLSNYSAASPGHNTILPFTRNVMGPMDFTPVTFTPVTYPHRTTYGHELALSVVYESGWQHFADSAEAYRGLPGPAKDFLKAVPAVWDESRLVTGEPGEFVVIARRKGKLWYVGGISGREGASKLKVDFCFLPTGKFEVQLVGDGEDERSFRAEELTVTAEQSRDVEVAALGGFVMRLVEVK
ncbi:MAG: glycoside hydrolase family 97 protein [Sedimentisphaerales bacterium]|nr:glycoside hydrolase family 97 protein [Sedimentisphaerales bacterium]